MNAIPRVFATVLLVTVLPTADAQSAAQQPPPDQPAAEQPKDVPTKDPQGSVDISKEVEHTVDAIRAYSVERRAEAMAAAKRATDDIDGQTQRLQEQMDQRWAVMSDAARTRSQATMADLRQRRSALAEWYGGLRHSSTAAWSEVRGGFVRSYHELADAMRKARAELDGNEKAGGAEQSRNDGKNGDGEK